jgi:hypothetical protein
MIGSIWLEHPKYPHYRVNLEGDVLLSNFAKLTTENVLEIRKADCRFRGGQAKLAKYFGISASLVSQIRSGKAWAHLKKSLGG